VFKDIKKLRRLLKLQEESEAQIRIEGKTPEGLKDEIEWQQNEVKKNVNAFGWILMFGVVIPLALMEVGFSEDVAFAINYALLILIFVVILPCITGER